MQVIGGSIKGLKLDSIKTEDIRPSKDRIKKSIFDILRFEIKDTVFLDLFGGTGQIGIEAFSQGAKEVLIIEPNKFNASIIKKNIQKIKIPHNIKLFTQSASDFLSKNNLKFDIVFLDPPYKNISLLNDSLEKISNLSNLPNFVIIETLSSTDDLIKIEKFYLRKKYHYGKISLILYEKI